MKAIAAACGREVYGKIVKLITFKGSVNRAFFVIYDIMMSGDDMKVLDTLGKSKKAIGGIIAILLCIVAIFFAGMKFADGKENDKITSTTIRNQLTEINELAVYSYDYSKVGKFSNKLSFNGWDISSYSKEFYCYI